jgi:hypothetical protein
VNERIAKLYDQALVLESNGDYVAGELDPVKFADLIVSEAIGVVQKRYMGDQNREDMEVRRCVADLKKHFGVE